MTSRYVGWLNDKQVVKYSEQRHSKHTIESCKKYYQSFIDSPNLFLGIISNREDIGHIGNITVVIDLPNGTAEVSIMIGEKKIWGKGLGKEAWKLVLDYLLKLPKIRKVSAGTMSTNLPMLSLMKSAGMEIECIRKSHLLLDRVPVDIVISSIFSKNFKGK